MTETSVDPRPVPAPDETTGFFWDGARNGQLLLQRCASCSRYQYPPDVACIDCQSQNLVAEEVSGRAHLYTYAVVDRAFAAPFVEAVPYVVALVELVEQPDLRMLTNIVDAAPDDLQIGMPLEVVFEPRGDFAIPQFRPLT